MSDRSSQETGGSGDCYRVYVLRLWCQGDEPGRGWRCSLEDPSTRDRRGFRSLEELTVHLQAMTGGVRPCGDQKEG
jgi:hypothetical protein